MAADASTPSIPSRLARRLPAAPWILVAVAVLLRAAVLWWRQGHDPLVDQPLNDAEVYLGWARAILAGQPFGPEDAPFYLAPLYPHVLAGLLRLGDGALWPILVVQHVLGVAVVLGIWRLARQLAGDLAGLLAGVLALLAGPLLWYEGWLLPTTLNVALLVLIMNLAVAVAGAGPRRWWLPLVLGLTLGLAAIHRPQNLLLLAGLVVWLAVRARTDGGRAWLTPAITLGLALLTIAPVTLRNLQASGEPVLITANGGVNLYFGNHDAADGRFSLAPGFPPTIEGQQQASRGLAERDAGHRLTWSAVSRHWFGRSMSTLTSDPGHALGLWARKLRLLVSWREMENNFLARWVHGHTGPGRVLPPSLGWLWVVAMPVLVVVVRRPEPRDVPLLILMGVMVAVAVLFWVSTRNRLPLVIPLAVWGGRALAQPALWRRTATLVAVAVMALFVVWPTGENEGAEFYVSLGGVHAQAGEFQLARQAFEDALEIQPMHPMALNNLALTYLDTGDPRTAIAILNRALARYPRFELARRNLAEAKRALQGR